ncbi:unnamed protein product, partial [Polarella glacialis]
IARAAASAKVTRQQSAVRTAARKYVTSHATRQSDIPGAQTVGSGAYKKWLPEAMLRCSFGSATMSAFTSSLASKSPCCFSVNALAYWLHSSTSHICKVRNTVAKTFLDCQEEVLKALSDPAWIAASGKYDAVKLHVEFDETSQVTRVRHSMREILACFETLVQRTELFISRGNTFRRASLINTPAVISHTTAGCIWQGMLAKQPIHPFHWALTCHILILTYISDCAKSNLLLMRWITKFMP